MKLFMVRCLFLLASTWSALAQAGQEYGFWVDDKRVIGTLMSSSVEFGFDGYGRYVAAAGLRRYGRTTTSDLGYQVNYGGSGRTQWVSFDFVGTNIFGSPWNTNSAIQGWAHLPIFMRAGQMDDGVEAYAAEGKGIFLGRNSVWGDCGAPWDKARIFFETKVINSAEGAMQRNLPPAQRIDPSKGAVKCADGYADKFFEDGVTYRLTMHVNDTHIAYWLYKQDPYGNMVLWSSNGTYALDYPATSFNSAFIQALGQPWFGYDYGRMNNNNINALVLALVLPPEGIGTWNLKITNLNAGRF
ncbi:hypothetical protein [Hyalangium versicolor]|uniref:hypothetical protein n=1 Tax=Hyalangium versicolor TaxID=2861190 RepID=UPI001CCB7938|nr:hypothetical protein [Hyalangium versicolor]